MAGGVFLGLLAPQWADHLEFLSTLFLRLIRSIIAPVLIGVLIRSIGGARKSSNSWSTRLEVADLL